MQLWTPKQQLQNGKFTIEKVLGGGGFGVTYSAIDKNTNNIVAIKTLNPIHQSKPDFEKQQVKFVQEAFRLVQCSHPHIVKVHEVINESGLWGMVMEYIQGQDLSVYISQRGKLSEVEALKYINQVGTALEYIHQQGMLHRDVKPNNIVLRQSQQEAVLIDFGLAREFNLNQTGSMTNSRTEGYAPIEQYERRGKFGTYTDVYALAATLYALVTGGTPLPANFRQTGIPLPSPKQRNPNISDRLNDGIIKGMELEPKDRSQTVWEWLELILPIQPKPIPVINKPSIITPPVAAKSTPAKPVNNNKASTPQKLFQIPQNNIPGKIQLQKFKFEYAKIDENLKITKYPGEGEFFTEDLGFGVILEMVQIPGGSFIMGAPEDEEESVYWERPQHKVNIQPFFMGKYQLTQEQYQVMMKVNPSEFLGRKRPVEDVTCYDAVEFCKQLSKLTGTYYRLPTEAEWEYACRAGTTTPFHFGEAITTDLANYNGNHIYGAAPKGIYREQTTDVGTFPANPFGLYDMHGNVMEWCIDAFHRNYDGAPTDGSAWVNSENKNDNRYRLLRSGSWDRSADRCRSACRLEGYWDSLSSHYGSKGMGFRVVCAVGRDSIQKPTPEELLPAIAIPSIPPISQPQNNTPGKIQLQKFDFEYATLSVKRGLFRKKSKISYDRAYAEDFIRYLGFGAILEMVKGLFKPEITLHRGQAESFTEDLGFGVILEMVKIPGGSFIMGAPEDEPFILGMPVNDEETFNYAGPQHKVNIQPFFMGKYLITQEQYQAIMGKNPSTFKGEKRAVELVSWDDAVEFCTQLSKISGKKYRLPSEAEWEYACRAGTTTPFHFGETCAEVLDLANCSQRYIQYTGNLYEVTNSKKSDVGSFPANSFGLYDMHGYVWEYCLDHWHDNYKGAPIDGSAWVNHLRENEDRRVVRGGSWQAMYLDYCHSASRSFGGSGIDNGFRIACGIAPT